MSEPPSPLELLPHAGAARMITRIAEHGDGTITCEGQVCPEGPYVQHGICPAFVGLEVAAQAAALLELLAVRDLAPAPRAGYLVRARGVRCARPEFAAGDVLRAQVRRTAAVPPLFVYEIRVSDELGELLRGEIATYVGPD